MAEEEKFLRERFEERMQAQLDILEYIERKYARSDGLHFPLEELERLIECRRELIEDEL